MTVVTYARISEDKTGDTAGVQRQVQACQLLAEAKGWTIDKVYDRDSDISAWSGKERPDFERLLTAIDRGQVDKILVFHLDRLVRRMADLARIIELGRPRRLEIAAVHGVSLDLGDPTGIAVAQIITAIAEMESGHKGQRQRAANRQRAERGQVGWSRRPYGYEKAGGLIVTVLSEAAELRDAAEKILAGKTLASVCRGLNERGVTNSIGRPWTVTPLRRALLNPRYAGRAVSKGKDYGEGHWPAILDPDTHERLVYLLRDPRRQTAPSTTVKHLLSGLAKCGRCGATMFATVYRQRGRDPYMIYRCVAGKGHLVRKLDPVDEYVTNVILARIRRPDVRALLAPDVDLDALAAKAVDLRGRRDALAAMLGDGLVSADAAREQAEKITTRLRQVEREIEAHTDASPLAPFADAPDVRKVWDALTLPNKRVVIDLLCTVTIQPQGKGGKFDPATVQVVPHKQHRM